MKKLWIMISVMLLIFSADIFAKRGGGSSFRSSSRSSSFSKKSSGSRRSSSAFKKKSPAQVKKDKAATAKRKAVTVKKKKTEEKAKLDKKLNKQMASKDKAASKKYGTKKKAEQSYKADLAKKNKYDSKEPPAKRPDNIPQQVTVNNTNINTSYGAFPGGGYGYGYMNPMTNMFIAMAVTDMIVDSHRMRAAGYGHWNDSGQPIVYRSSAWGFLMFFLILIAVIVVVGIGIKFLG